MPWASQASATLWKATMGQPTQSIPWRMKTRIVSGHRRMISSSDIPGSSFPDASNA